MIQRKRFNWSLALLYKKVFTQRFHTNVGAYSKDFTQILAYVIFEH